MIRIKTETVCPVNAPNNPYMWRLKIGRLYLHKFYRGDVGVDPHDHPAPFYTFPLRSYVETVYEPLTNTWERRLVKAWRLHYRSANHCHIVLGRWTGERTITSNYPILLYNAKPFWTIVWWGKREREWGFWLLKNRIWIPWSDYVNGKTKTWVD